MRQTSIHNGGSTGRASKLPTKIALIAIVPILLIVALVAVQTSVHLRLVSSGTNATLTVDGTTHTYVWPTAPTRVALLPPDSFIREWGIDGSESLTLNTLDPAYLQSITSNPYIMFDRWLRGEDGYGEWRNVSLTSAVSKRRWSASDAHALAAGLPVPAAFVLDADIYRLERPVTVQFTASSGRYLLHLDRNARTVSIANNPTAGIPTVLGQWYFPTDPWPYAALDVRTMVYGVIWAALLVLLAVMLALIVPSRIVSWLCSQPQLANRTAVAIVALALTGSLALTLYSALKEYNGLPHVPDGQSYMMQAKVFASGRISLPLPALPDSFPVPLFGPVGRHWVSQYAPGTALTLIPGLLVGVPWLVQPLLGIGTLALVFALGRCLYGAQVAVIAVVLGSLSPLHSFLVGTYLSHVPAVFFGTLAYYLLVRSAWGHRLHLVILAGMAIGMTFLCREFSALLIGMPLSVCLVLVAWRRGGIRAASTSVLAWVGGAIPFVMLYGLYNWSITGDALLSPRGVLNPTDRYGFGVGHGWWGQHTLAAGLVNLDQLLTGLNLELFGWPYYMTLAVPLVPFVAARATRWDGLNAAIALSVLAGTVGYFYNGVTYGPRYLYEALPAFLLLTGRGVQELGAIAGDVLASLHRPRRAGHLAAHAILTACILPNLLFYLPRHLALYRDFTATPWMPNLPIARVYERAPHHAIIVTSDGWLYSRTLASLNAPSALASPTTTSDTVWALASTPSRYAQLRTTFPGRRVYVLTASGASVTYTPWRR